MLDLIKLGRADQLASSHRNILKWTKVLEAAISEQQRIFLKQGSMDQKKIGFYIMAMPSDELASLCVIHIMRHLLGEFLNNTNKDAERSSQVRQFDADLSTIDIKILAVGLFNQLGNLVDRQLK